MHRRPKYQYSALIQSPTNSIFSSRISCSVPARSPCRSTLRTAQIGTRVFSRQVVRGRPPFSHRELAQADCQGLSKIPGRDVDEVELRRIQVLDLREPPIEIADADSQVLRVARVADRQVQSVEAREIDALARDGLGQHVRETAALIGLLLGKTAGIVEVRLVDPLKVRGRTMTHGHREEVRAFARAVDRQPAFRKKAMPNHSQQRQQDADQ